MLSRAPYLCYYGLNHEYFADPNTERLVIITQDPGFNPTPPAV